jgi:RNA polymerase sigma-70 factor (ECF subfamily)
LISRAQAGDREAFAALFEQYKNLVYKTAYLILDDAVEAEDVLQEVFLLVYKSLSSFDPRKGAFTTWLHRITLNSCLNHRRKRHPSSLEDVSHILVSEFPGEQLAESESILRAMHTLSDKQQAVIVLRYYWDLPYAEIASILEIPLGTVKSRLDLGLKTLRKALEEQKKFSRSSIQIEACE